MKKSRLILAGVVLVLMCVACGLLYQVFKPATSAGDKDIKVTVIHGDKTQEEFIYQTDREYLGEVLTDNGLVDGEQGDYGMFILTVDGETADQSKQQWWCLTKGGEQVNTSADQTPIAHEDMFELTLLEGY